MNHLSGETSVDMENEYRIVHRSFINSDPNLFDFEIFQGNMRVLTLVNKVNPKYRFPIFLTSNSTGELKGDAQAGADVPSRLLNSIDRWNAAKRNYDAVEKLGDDYSEIKFSPKYNGFLEDIHPVRLMVRLFPVEHGKFKNFCDMHRGNPMAIGELGKFIDDLVRRSKSPEGLRGANGEFGWNIFNEMKGMNSKSRGYDSRIENLEFNGSEICGVIDAGPVVYLIRKVDYTKSSELYYYTIGLDSNGNAKIINEGNSDTIDQILTYKDVSTGIFKCLGVVK